MKEIAGLIFYTAQEVAEMIGVHVQTIRLWIKQGKLKGKKVGRCFLIYADDVKRMMGVQPEGDSGK
jgi:excisionase family DNA binding protein